MPGPYEGLRVVELGQYVAVPYCAQLLADGGAEVIKVEPLEGDPSRRNGQVIPLESRQYLNKNRGKRSLSVNLDYPQVRAAVLALIDRADVVLINFRPGQAERFGLDYQSVAQRNPRCVYAENTAFGTAGPLAGTAGVDMALQAYAGMAMLSGDGPAPLPNPQIDYAAALLLAWGVATALYHREKSGCGQKLDVALLQAALVLQNNQLNHIDAIDGWREEFVEYLKTAFVEGQTWHDVLARRDALQPHYFTAAYYGFFRTLDGTLALGAAGRPNQVRALAVLGLSDRWVSEPGWLPEDTVAYGELLRSRVAAVLQTRTTADWVRAFTAANVPAAPVRLAEQVLDDEQSWANEFFVRVEHEVVGGLTLVAPPVKFSETRLAVRAASPTLGRDSRAILREAGLSEGEIEQLIAEGAVRAGAE